MGPVAWLARRQLSFLTLLGVLGAGQLLLHEAFLALSAPAPCPASLGEPLGHHNLVQGVGCPVPESVTVLTGSGAPSPAMLAAHLLALLATAWLLRGGEAALWQLLAWLRPLVRLPQTPWIVPVRYRPAAADFVLVLVPRLNLPPRQRARAAGRGNRVRRPLNHSSTEAGAPDADYLPPVLTLPSSLTGSTGKALSCTLQPPAP